jgi:drug/metabolite transporter (DMT)-like permease
MSAFLALFSSLLWGSSDYAGGQLTKRYSPIAVTSATQAISLVFGLLIALVISPFHGEASGLHGYFFNGVIAGIAGYIGIVCLYSGLATGRMGVVSPISALGATLPVAVALVGGEVLSKMKLAGVILALIGAFCASGPEFSGGFSLKPLLFAFGAAGGFGLALTFMARGSASNAFMTMLSMRIATIVLGIFLALRYRTLGGFKKADTGRLIFVGIADFAANVLLGIATTHGYVSIAIVLGSLFPVVTVGLAFIILRERLHKVQYFGAIFAVAGVCLVSL